MVESAIETLIDNAALAGASEVNITIDDATAGVAIRIADNGPGIPDADRGRVFEPFFTTARAEGGTGLGLTIARTLLRQSGGELLLTESGGNRSGAVFVITLPAA